MYRRIRGRDLGKLEATPTAFPVDSNQSFTLRYTAGRTPVAEGGRIRLLTPRLFSAPNLIRRGGGRTGWSPGFTEIAVDHVNLPPAPDHADITRRRVQHGG